MSVRFVSAFSFYKSFCQESAWCSLPGCPKFPGNIERLPAMCLTLICCFKKQQHEAFILFGKRTNLMNKISDCTDLLCLIVSLPDSLLRGRYHEVISPISVFSPLGNWRGVSSAWGEIFNGNESTPRHPWAGWNIDLWIKLHNRWVLSVLTSWFKDCLFL